MGSAHRFMPVFEAAFPHDRLILDPDDGNIMEVEVIFEGTLDETIMLAWPGLHHMKWLLDWLAGDCLREHVENLVAYPESADETRMLGWSVKVYYADQDNQDQVPLYARTS